MRIFVIPSNYKSELNIQANIFVHEQCEALIERGHSLVVLDASTRSYKHWNKSICCKPEVRFEGSVKVYSYCVRGFAQTKLPRFATRQFLNNIEALWKVATAQEGTPDVIYAHFSFPSAYCASILSRKYNVPIVTMEHAGMYLDKNIHPVIVKELTETVKNSDRFICVSEAHADRIQFLTKVNSKVEVIPNMISNRFTYFPPSQNERFVFFSAGNLKPVKRFDLLISSFCNAFSADEQVVLRIAGGGKEREKLKQLIKENNREHQIMLLGRLDRDSILEEYKNCNCFALVSSHESFGIAYREAMLCGRPIVATDNGGIRDGWDDSFGYLAPCGDLNAIADSLRLAYDNYSRFDFLGISSQTYNFCSQDIVIDKIESALFSVVGKDE